MITKAKQRVLIAKDALKWEAAGALRPSETRGYVYPVKSPWPYEDDYKQARDVNIGPCHVCALGGLFVAKAVRYNAVTIRQLTWGHGGAATECLEDHFSIEQLELIEGCYEIWPWRSEDALRWGRFNRPERFRRIMKNIIRNKGTFVSWDVRP